MECQSVCDQMRTFILSVLIWVHTACKCYLQTTKVTGEKCLSAMPQLGIEPRLLGPKSDNLPCCHKSQSVDKLALPHIPPPFLDPSSNLSLSLNKPIYQTGMCSEPIGGLFTMGAKCNQMKKCLSPMPQRGARSEIRHSTKSP